MRVAASLRRVLPWIAGLAALAACSRPPEIPPANVILVLVDTLRADHLGTYGYARPTSPAIDRLAAGGVLFAQARSVAPWTNPAIAALFTGHHPNALFEPHPHAEAIRLPLPARVPTLASKLHAAGFKTLAFIDHPGISPGLGFSRGFDTFVQLYHEFGGEGFGTTDGHQIVELIGRQLAAVGKERYFLYLHLIYPHRPYQPPPGYVRLVSPEPDTERKTKRRQRLIDTYDGEIRYTDDVVAELMAKLESVGRRDDTWVVLTADHGEGFFEHGREEHGNSLYDELLHVPLILIPPPSARVAPRRVETRVSLIDVHPTVLDLAGLRAEGDRAGLEGSSLLRFLRGSPPRESGELFSEQPHGGDIRGAAIVEGRWKLIRRDEPEMPPMQLYDLDADPVERDNRAAAEPEIVRRLDQLLGRHLLVDRMLLRTSRSEADKPEDLDDETIRRLKALGYLQ